MSQVKCALLKRSQNTFNDYCRYQEHKTQLLQFFLQCFIQKYWKISRYFQRIPVCNGMETEISICKTFIRLEVYLNPNIYQEYLLQFWKVNLFAPLINCTNW